MKSLSGIIKKEKEESKMETEGMKEIIDLIETEIDELQEEKTKEVAKLIRKYDAQIESLMSAINVIREVSMEVCPRCGGKGFHWELDDAGIESDTVKCKVCGGKGKILAND